MKNPFDFPLRTVGLALLLSTAATVQADTVSASGSGWINELAPSGTGFGVGINNHFSGWEGVEYNNWFSFQLPNITFSSATLYIWNDGSNPDPSPLDSTAYYSLFQASDYSFAGLASGAALGQVDLVDANTSVGHYVGITLNADGLDALNASAGASFNFGGSVTTTFATPQDTYDQIAIFGWTGGTPLAYLEFNVAQVPEPGTYALMLAGLGLVGVMTRRRSA